MDLFTRDDLRLLIDQQQGPCVSLFMPTHRAGPAIRQDPIRLKNLLRAAEEQLAARGMRAADARALLSPARDLLDDELFWRHQREGLALFTAPNLFRFYRLPLPLDECLLVADRFHVKPVLPLLMADGTFYTLALSQHGVRLLRGTRQTIDQVNVPGIPTSVEETEGYEPGEKQEQVQALAPPSSGTPFAQPSHAVKTEFHRGKGSTATVHGHGRSSDMDTRDIERYFRHVDAGLMKVLHDESVPLVLVGVEYLLPLYRGVSNYPRILEEGVIGNPEELRDDELHQRAWAVVEPVFQRAREEAADRFRESLARGRASDRLVEAIRAAYNRRLAFLFAPLGIQYWGTFDPDTQAVHVHQERQAGDEDLLNLAILHTLLNQGTVYTVPQTDMPVPAPVAATFRY